MTGPEQDRLDEMIERQMAGTVPGEAVVEEVNPWYEPITRIVTGMALTGITLNFLYLQYLLPTLGIVLQYLGFRTLRRSGPAFRLAWALSLVRLIWQAVVLVLDVTPWLPSGALNYALGFAAMGVQIIQLLALRAGLRRICREAGIEQQGDPLRAAVIWQLVIVVLAFSPLAQSWLAFIPMIAAFALIIRSLARVGGSLGGAGYCFVPAPVRMSSGLLKWGYLLLCLVLVLLTSFCVNHPRLDAQPVPETQGEAETRQALAALGLPEDVLADLPDEHVRALEGALRVDVQEETLIFHTSDSHEERMRQAEMPEESLAYDFVPPAPENRDWVDPCPTLLSRMAYIELPDSRMAVLNWFAWQQGGAHWGDAVMLGWQDSYEYLTGQIGGALLYEKDGQAYTAPIPRLNDGVVTTNDWFFGTQSDPRITGTVSYPFGAQDQRGYVLYILQLRDLEYTARLHGNTMLNYRHRVQPFSLPYRTPAELASGWTDNTLRQHLGLFEAVGRDGGQTDTGL